MKNNKTLNAFDEDKYIKTQKQQIYLKMKKFDKLYLEFGGKLLNDEHSSHVLPGFNNNLKIDLLKSMKDKAEIIYCVSANDIEKNKVNADFEQSFENNIITRIKSFRQEGLFISSIVITLFKGQPNVIKFINKLKAMNEKVFLHEFTKGYPNNIDVIVSEEGYGKNEYIPTSRPLVIIASPKAGSGKLATALSQIYHDYKNGIKSGLAKFEMFPVWNLPIKHPLNVAFEVAMADENEVNLIDPYYFNKYGKLAVGYNKDIETFPILCNILEKITGKKFFNSPTEMTINTLLDSITNIKIVEEKAKHEIIRRYFKAECDYKKGQEKIETVSRIKYLMAEIDLNENYLDIVTNANKLSRDSGFPCIALKTNDNKFIYGKTKKYISACGAMVLNALREMSRQGDDFDIISDEILMPIVNFRANILKQNQPFLSIDDILIALSISAQTNEKAKKAISCLGLLNGTEAHATYMLPSQERITLKNLGIKYSCQPIFLEFNK